MKVIGITGGIGAGKSTVLTMLERDFHARTLEADQIARQLMQPDGVVYRQVVEAFSEDILNADGSICRERLSERVFRAPELLTRLNAIVHPAVKQAIRAEIQTRRAAGDCPYLVIEAALLIEDGYRSICDELWYVYAPEETRIRRLMTGRGYSREKCLSVIRSQSGEAFYRDGCDWTLDNGGSPLKLKKQVEERLKNETEYGKLV